MVCGWKLENKRLMYRKFKKKYIVGIVDICVWARVYVSARVSAYVPTLGYLSKLVCVRTRAKKKRSTSFLQSTCI